jgi:hypothetical protein
MDVLCVLCTEVGKVTVESNGDEAFNAQKKIVAMKRLMQAKKLKR